MCGISGYIGISKERREIVERMRDEMRHRGPDDQGLWSDEQVVLGHNRLSILDLSPNGHQPMVRNDWVIIFNGEIYNFEELREELQASHGRPFVTGTDTEVILAAWEVWGRACLQRFRGMWAFCLYNRKTHELVLSRDRFGIKPLYYFQDRSKFIFASEIKALFKDPSVPRKACLSVVSDYLLVGFHDHRQETFFEGIRQLPPGSSLFMDTQTGGFSLEHYYDLSERVRNRRGSVAEFGDAFASSVKLHLRSDVPVGTCLSGGLDSSSVASLASTYVRRQGEVFRAVTGQSGDPANDETEYARLVVERAALEWHVTKPTTEDYREHWERCLWHQDEPSGGPSVFMQYWVMKASHEAGLKVMLDGQGGDECLLGYERYYPTLFLHWLKKGHLGTFAHEFFAAARHSKLSLSQLVLYSFYFLTPKLREARLRKRVPWLPPSLTRESFERLECSMRDSRDPLTLQLSEIGCFQLPHLLKYEDRNSMAWSVESRVPFVDHEVIEAALSLAPEDKIRNGYTKWALRKVMNGKMPDAVTWRREKVGFEAPKGGWSEGNRNWMSDVIQTSSLLKELGVTDAPDDGPCFQALFNLAHWQKIFRVN